MADKFNKDFIRKVQEEIERKVIDRMDTLALHIHNRLTVATDVDYGQARAGWNIATNEIDFSIPKRPIQPKKTKGLKVKKIILPPPASRIKQKARKLGDSYFITNNVAHIKYMNEGTDSRPPTHFIEREIIQGVADKVNG